MNVLQINQFTTLGAKEEILHPIKVQVDTTPPWEINVDLYGIYFP